MKYIVLLNGRKYGIDVTDSRADIIEKFELEDNKKPYGANELDDIPDLDFEPDDDELVNIVTRMPGKVMMVVVSEGDVVKTGDALMTVESMKMEYDIIATKDGKIKKIYVDDGQNVRSGEKLVDIEIV